MAASDHTSAHLLQPVRALGLSAELIAALDGIVDQPLGEVLNQYTVADLLARSEFGYRALKEFYGLLRQHGLENYLRE